MQSSASKILMISARSDIGGGPAQMWTLVQGLMDRASIFVALPNDGDYFDKFIGLLGAERVLVIPRQKFTIKALLELWTFCRNYRVDLVHSHGKGAGLYSRVLALIAGLPVVHTLHGYHDGRYPVWLKYIYALWESAAAFLTKRILCVSESEAVLFKAKVLVPANRLVVIPNGTDAPPTVAASPRPNKIVTVARLDFQKNLLELLKVAKHLPEYDFFVIGDGADRLRLEAEISAQRLRNVTLCGKSHKVLEDISDSTVYLTTARWEGLPLAVLEAMSLGIPVVASDVVGNRDAVEDGITGYLYPLGRVETAAFLLKKAAALDRNLIKAHHREHFSSARMIDETERLYQAVISNIS